MCHYKAPTHSPLLPSACPIAHHPPARPPVRQPACPPASGPLTGCIVPHVSARQPLERPSSSRTKILKPIQRCDLAAEHLLPTSAPRHRRALPQQLTVGDVFDCSDLDERELDHLSTVCAGQTAVCLLLLLLLLLLAKLKMLFLLMRGGYRRSGMTLRSASG